jgi:hypothetical protein
MRVKAGSVLIETFPDGSTLRCFVAKGRPGEACYILRANGSPVLDGVDADNTVDANRFRLPSYVETIFLTYPVQTSQPRPWYTVSIENEGTLVRINDTPIFTVEYGTMYVYYYVPMGRPIILGTCKQPLLRPTFTCDPSESDGGVNVCIYLGDALLGKLGKDGRLTLHSKALDTSSAAHDVLRGEEIHPGWDFFDLDPPVAPKL